MSYRRLLAFTLFLGVLLTGCDSGSPTASKVYTDSLTTGTGRRGNEITGQTTEFTDNHSIYWRVESARQFGPASVEMTVEQNVESYGWKVVHQMSSIDTPFEGNVGVWSYFHNYGPGQFRMTAGLSSGTNIGTVIFTVQESPAAE